MGFVYWMPSYDRHQTYRVYMIYLGKASKPASFNLIILDEERG